jgi:nicotinate phosphoribosyltransferase
MKYYDHSLALLTDLYQLTMSYGYWKAGFENKEAVFHLFFRRPPFHGGFTIAAGLELVIDYVNNFRFDESDLTYLASLKAQNDQPLFEPAFFDYLADLKFSCDIDAVPEGTVVFPYEPLLRIQGPLIQCQLFESPFLNLINFSTLIATKASRICIAAQDEPVLEFGMRRAQGIDGALTASRSAYIGGCAATSNVLAGKLFNIPVSGTHSHSWVMVFDDELEAFLCYARNQPNNCVFLVDTYDTLEGVKKAIEAGNWLKSHGKELYGIRLDSGDLAYLSIKSRELLDAAGFHHTKIYASNELDETIIGELKRQGAQITMWGVGTNLVTAKDQPALDGVYKLSAIRNPGEPWRYKLKLSEQMMKISNPGILQVRRFQAKKGYADSIQSSPIEYAADALYDINTDLSKGDTKIIDPLDATLQKVLKKGLVSQDLLTPIFRGGRSVYTLPSLAEIRQKSRDDLANFHVGIKRFLYPHRYIVGMEQSLYDLKVGLIEKIRNESSQAYITPDD